MKAKPTVFQIAAAYIGTVVGAGFASGQEVLQFFAAYGLWGAAGMAVSSLLFFFIGYSILMLGRGLHAQSHLAIVRCTNGSLLGALIDVIITVFMFGGLAAMLAGAGAIMNEQFAVAAVWGMLAMAIAAFATVARDTQGMVRAMSVTVPFLIVAVLYVCAAALLKNPITRSDLSAAARLGGATPNWLLSAVNYASYNIVISIGVLAPLGASCGDKRTLRRGALIGALGLALGLAAIYLCILTAITKACVKEVPMLEAAKSLSAFVRAVFALVLMSAVYTTAIGNLFGLVQRAANTPALHRLPRWAFAAATVALAFAVAQLGFSGMVKTLYPAVGYGGMLFFGGIVYVWVKKRSVLRQENKE